MIELKYKTRAMSNPKGKPRVYFCCHPKDFGKLFESISDEILKKQNCSIWYLEDGAAERDEAFLEDLKQMQLFVMPVTTPLLCTKNPALDVEFKFAMEQHIPVLPLMMEGGLDELFNQKCGDLQFLDKNSKDGTAISFDEKLEKYLASVLIGDELAEKIRAAFDAYVFLSYRKKDRKYAQELMHLIHKNDFCRDIAIWYDEFLTPGENFNDSIKQALEKSDLFVLTVTPNLVNEINYIMTTEYPMAKKEEKEILPVELVPTDKDELRKRYEQIPLCTDAHNETELKNALLEAVKRIAIKENDASPEHNFFIGLAYLGGVDVEVDYEKAVSLIISAAKTGLLEAMDKLVEMYRNGIGVSRNYGAALEWQEKKVEQLEREYETDKNDKTLDLLCENLIRCGNYYREFEKLKEAEQKYRNALQHIEQSEAGSQNDQILRNKCVCCYRIGDISRARGYVQEAGNYYKKALEISKRLVEKEGLRKAGRDLSISFEKLGNVFLIEKNFKNARSHYEKALEIADLLARETGTTESWRDLIVCYEKMGDVNRAEGDIWRAGYCYEKSLEISKSLANELGTPEARRDLYVGYIKAGNILIEKKDIETAEKYYGSAIEISYELAHELGTLQSRQDLYISYYKLGKIRDLIGKKKSAAGFYEKAIEILESLVKELGTVKMWDALAICYYRYAMTIRFFRKLYLKKALDIYRNLCEKCPDVEEYKRSYHFMDDCIKGK